MAEVKKKKQNKNGTPKKTRGCRPSKQAENPRTLKEALQIKLKEVISVEDSSGKTKKMPYYGHR